MAQADPEGFQAHQSFDLAWDGSRFQVLDAIGEVDLAATREQSNAYVRANPPPA